MCNRKRVTLTFEVDDHGGYNDEAFMQHDFLQELSCCVNDPCEGTFALKVEDADVPHEMSAREYIHTFQKMCEYVNCCPECPLYGLVCGKLDTPVSGIDEAVAIVAAWAREHPEEGREGHGEF